MQQKEKALGLKWNKAYSRCVLMELKTWFQKHEKQGQWDEKHVCMFK